ncbi:MAG: hypothetical protein ACLQVN_14210 [Bryobacteraceae bacterium]
MKLSIGKPALAHALANVLLLWLGYYWLGLGEGRASALAWSALVALALVCLGSWCYGAAFLYFAPATRAPVLAAWRTALRHLLPLAVAAMLLLFLYLALDGWTESRDSWAAKTASWFTLKLRQPVRPAAVLRAFDIALWLVRWMVLPVLWLPMLAGIASVGWRGFLALGSRWRKPLYWLEAPVLLWMAVWVPLKLLAWIPEISGFSLQMASFVVRAAAAYLLFVAGWLGIAFVTSGGKPRLTQSNTAVSP